jgi:hypothetical protein
MDGAQHVQGYIGYGPIPNKQQPEPVYTGVNAQGKGVSPWPEKWEGTFTPCYAATATAFETGFPGPNGQPILPPRTIISTWRDGDARPCSRGTTQIRRILSCGCEA